MSSNDPSKVKTLGLFEKRIQGDDCLRQLAQRRFGEAGMGAEMHAATPEQLDWSLKFRPGQKHIGICQKVRGAGVWVGYS
jgi:hypothetical protein